MSHYNLEQIEQQFNSLPQTLKDAIMSLQTAETIKKIGDDHKLHIDEIGRLADETGLVMLGFTRPYMFTTKLIHSLNLTRVEATDLAEDINNQIFFPIRSFLENPQTYRQVATDKLSQSNQELFDKKLTGLFKTTKDQSEAYQTPNQLDPYNELIE